MASSEPSQTRPAIVPGNPAARALQLAVAVCIEDFERHRAALHVSDDAEGPHGARVALRRLRVLLRGFGPILRRKAVVPVKAEAKAMFRLLGRLRDADVLAKNATEPGETERLTARAAKTRAEVRLELDARGASGFQGQAQAFFGGSGWRRKGAKARRWRKGAAEALATRALRRAWRRVRSHGKRVAAMPVDARHGFRKDLKDVRYLTDFFGPLWAGKAQAAFLLRLRRLQDALGELNDLALADAQLGGTGRAARDRRAAAAITAAEREWKALRRGQTWWQGG